jgi:hypothetical protein
MQRLAEYETAQQLLQQEGRVHQLLLAAVPPAIIDRLAPEAENLAGSVTLSLDNTSLQIPFNTSSSSGGSGSGSGSSSSSSTDGRERGQWSSAVASAALQIIMEQLVMDGVGIEAVSQHVGLLLQAMQQTQHSQIADQAADLLLQTTSLGGGSAAICNNPENLGRLLSVMQLPVRKPHRACAVGLASRVLRLLCWAAPESETIRQLLSEQSRFDALVRLTQHSSEEIALAACNTVMVVVEAAYTPPELQPLLQQLLPDHDAQPQQQIQQAALANVARQLQLQQQQKQQLASAAFCGDRPTLAAAVAAGLLLPPEGVPVLQQWHLQLLVEAAQNPLLARSAVQALFWLTVVPYSYYALLLAPDKMALFRAVHRLVQLAGLGFDWDDLDPKAQLHEQAFEILKGQTVSFLNKLKQVWAWITDQGERAVQKMQEYLEGEVVREQQAATVQFLAVYLSSKDADGSSSSKGRLEDTGPLHKKRCNGSSNAGSPCAAAAAETAAADAGGGGRLVQQQQQRQLLQDALTLLISCSKRRTDIEELLQASRKEL